MGIYLNIGTVLVALTITIVAIVKYRSSSMESKFLKNKCDNLLQRLLEEEGYNTKLKGGLDEVSKSLNTMSKNGTTKYVTVEEPKDQVVFWQEIKNINENDYFKWFLCQFKELILTQYANGLESTSKIKFLLNSDEISGAIKAHDMMVSQMDKMDYNIQMIENSEAQNGQTV